MTHPNSKRKGKGKTKTKHAKDDSMISILKLLEISDELPTHSTKLVGQAKSFQPQIRNKMARSSSYSNNVPPKSLKKRNFGFLFKNNKNKDKISENHNVCLTVI